MRKYLCDKTTDYRPINTLICPDSQWFYLDLVFHRVKYLHSSSLPIGQKGFSTCQIFTRFQAERSLSHHYDLSFMKPDSIIFGEFHQFRMDGIVYIHKKTVYPDPFESLILVNNIWNGFYPFSLELLFGLWIPAFLRSRDSKYGSVSRFNFREYLIHHQ